MYSTRSSGYLPLNSTGKLPSGIAEASGFEATSTENVSGPLLESQLGEIEKDVVTEDTSGSWWMPVMLLDRTLLLMCAIVVLSAIVMITICLVYLPKFSMVLANSPYTTAVKMSTGSCDKIEKGSTAIHFFINIIATIILGTSNTYQQLVTALTASDLRRAVRKCGDARIGTNSPMAIRHKTPRARMWRSYFSWVFLVMTSLPIHLLANSVIGSTYDARASLVSYTYNETWALSEIQQDLNPEYNGTTIDSNQCWFAFTTGGFSFWDYNYQISLAAYDYGESSGESSVSPTYDDPGMDPSSLFLDVANTGNIAAYSAEICQSFAGSNAENQSGIFLGDEWNAINISHIVPTDTGSILFECVDRTSCSYSSSSAQQCSLTIRLSAAIPLAICLLAKGIYMSVVNYTSRTRERTACLSFGDVIASSVHKPTLQLPNECMANADSLYRRAVSHTCHKHCKDAWASSTGNGLGHCQKCSKFNITNFGAGLESPFISMKAKKSLIATLGGASVGQIFTLMSVTFSMLGASCYAIYEQIGHLTSMQDICKIAGKSNEDCVLAQKVVENDRRYGFGGYGAPPLTSLGYDSMQVEFLGLLVSNGAQLIYSALYLLLIYNLTLISTERDWGKLERKRTKLRTTITKGAGFRQSYFMQLPKTVLIPIMIYSATMHWLLGQSISARGYIFESTVVNTYHTGYDLVFAPFTLYASTILMIGMTVVCWLTFYHTREGFVPTMYGSARACFSATSGMKEIRSNGVKWGDLGVPAGARFRRAGLSSDEVGPIRPGELYA